MHQISTKTGKSVFLSKFKKPSYLYPTKFSNVNYIKPTYELNKCKFRISVRRPFLWNEFLAQTEKERETFLNLLYSFKTFNFIFSSKILSASKISKYL